MRIARKQALYEVIDVVGVHIYSGRLGYLIALLVDDYMKRNTWRGNKPADRRGSIPLVHNS